MINCGLVIQRPVHAGRRRSLASRKFGAVAFLSCAVSPVAWHFKQGAAVLVERAGHGLFGWRERLDLLRNERLGLMRERFEEKHQGTNLVVGEKESGHANL